MSSPSCPANPLLVLCRSSSEHGLTIKQVVIQEARIEVVSVCVCGHQLDIQVNSCLPKCHFLSPTISHAHKPTREVPHTVWHTCLALGCNEHISSQIPSTTEVQQNHWPQQPPKYTCTNFSGTVLLVRLLRCGLSWQLSFWELNSVKVLFFFFHVLCVRVFVWVSLCSLVYVCVFVHLYMWKPNQQIASSHSVVFCLLMQQIHLRLVSKPEMSI